MNLLGNLSGTHLRGRREGNTLLVIQPPEAHSFRRYFLNEMTMPGSDFEMTQFGGGRGVI